MSVDCTDDVHVHPETEQIQAGEHERWVAVLAGDLQLSLPEQGNKLQVRPARPVSRLRGFGVPPPVFWERGFDVPCLVHWVQ